MRKLFVFSLLLIWLTAIGQKHPFSFYDMIKMTRISQLTASPDGKYLAVVGTIYRLEDNGKSTDIYLYDTNSKKFENITKGKGSNFNPLFAPDGSKMYFLSSRSKNVQIFCYNLTQKNTEQITYFPVSVFNLKLSPDGKYFVFSVEAYSDESSLEKIAERNKANNERLNTDMQYTELPIRHWDTWENHTWNHLYIMNINDKNPKDIMQGIKGNCPSKPWGGTEEFDISPDGRYIAYTTKLGSDRMWTTNFDVYIYDTKTGKTKNITAANKAWDRVAFFSPDGKYLYYLAMKIPQYEADRFRIMKYDLKTGKTENLTENFEVNPSDIIISPDGKNIYFTGDSHGRMKIFSLNTKNRTIKTLVGEHSNTSLNLMGDKLYFLQQSFVYPYEIFSLDLKKNRIEKISHFNDAILSQVQFGEYEEFSFKNSDGIEVYGWLLKPVNFDANKKYPLAFYIHGGPQGAWHDGFHFRWNLEIAPSQGYVAVAINFRGSTGYGDEFKEAISGHWGDRPYNDLMEGLDYVLKTYNFIDKNRIGALGASYGGYMINYLMGKAPEKFDAFVCHDGLFDLKSMYYETEELWFPEHETDGTPWKNPDEYEKFSPSTYVTNWKKPLLIIHGGQDFRVPETQGFSAFTAAQRLGIPSKLLYFPDENHFVLKPKNSEIWHREVFEWLDKYVKNK